MVFFADTASIDQFGRKRRPSRFLMGFEATSADLLYHIDGFSKNYLLAFLRHFAIARRVGREETIGRKPTYAGGTGGFIGKTDFKELVERAERGILETETVHADYYHQRRHVRLIFLLRDYNRGNVLVFA